MGLDELSPGRPGSNVMPGKGESIPVGVAILVVGVAMLMMGAVEEGSEWEEAACASTSINWKVRYKHK
jgi:hypothetical protein